MYLDTLLNNNHNTKCSLQIGCSANHPITSSDAMIKDYCKKEMMELQRQHHQSNKNNTLPPPQQHISSANPLLILSSTQNISSSSQNVSLSSKNISSSSENTQLNLFSATNKEDLPQADEIEQYDKLRNDDDDDDENNEKGLNDGNGNQGRWTKEEHLRFVEGLSLYGKNWKKVEEHVASRTGSQIRSHAQKFFNKLERDYNKKHGLPLPFGLNTTSSTKHINNQNINLPNHMLLKKFNSSVMRPSSSSSKGNNNSTKILGEKNINNNPTNILNNMQCYEQSNFFGKAIEASLQATQSQISHPQQSSGIIKTNNKQNMFLKQTMLTNPGNTIQYQQNHNSQLSKSFSQGSSSPQYNLQLTQYPTQQLITPSQDVPSLFPSISLRNRSDSVASNFTIMSDDDHKLSEEEIRQIKDSLPQAVNFQNLNECISHYTQLTLNLQKQLHQSPNPQNSLQIQQQINTFQSTVQFLNAYQSFNNPYFVVQSSNASQKEQEFMMNQCNNLLNSQNNKTIYQQSLANQMLHKGVNYISSINNQFQSNKENNVCPDMMHQSNNKGFLDQPPNKKQQTKQNLILNELSQINLQNPTVLIQESDYHPTDYESFFNFILKKYGKIFDQPQANDTSENRYLANYQPRLNQFLSFDGDSNISCQSSNLFQVESNSISQTLNNQIKDISGIPSTSQNSISNILLGARKNSFTLYDNEDEQKVHKLNLLRKKICTEKDKENKRMIVLPSNTVKTGQDYKQNLLAQSSQVSIPTINIPASNIQSQQDQGQKSIISNVNPNYFSPSQSLSNILQSHLVSTSSIVDIQSLLDDHHIRSTTNDSVEQPIMKDSIQDRPRFSFSDNNSQFVQTKSQPLIDENVEQESQKISTNYSDDILTVTDQQAIEQQQQKLLDAYSKLQKLLVNKNSQNISKIIVGQQKQQQPTDERSQKINLENVSDYMMNELSQIEYHTPQQKLINDCVKNTEENELQVLDRNYIVQQSAENIISPINLKYQDNKLNLTKSIV